MKFAISFSIIAPPEGALSWDRMAQDMVQMAPEVEAMGFDGIHVLEHHFQRDGWNPSPLLALAAISSVTDRIRLATDILLATLYNPVKLAEDTAVLDNLCGGRLTLGLAPGYVTEEFAGLMVPYEGRARRFEEVVDILQLAWTQETFEYQGEFFTVPPTRLTPRPLQSPHPPLWYGVSGPLMMERAARRGALLVGSPRHTVPELAQHFDTYAHACAQVGFVPTERPIGRGVFLARSRQAAVEAASPGVTHLFRELYGRKSAEGERVLTADDGTVISDASTVDFETFKERYIIGTPEEAIERIAQLRDEVGMTELVSWMQLPFVTREQTLESARLLAEEVMPAFR